MSPAVPPAPDAPPAGAPPIPAVPFREALRFWAKLGCISFGGPAAQIAVMHEELVVRRRWLPADRFDHALNFCMVLPGPEAQQLATYSGWLLHGTRGGLCAGILFVLPAAVLLFALSWGYAAWGSLHAIAGMLWGCKAVVVALVLEAGLRLGRRALRRPVHALFAVAAFVLLFAFAVPFPWVVLGAGVAGLLLPAGAPPPRDPHLVAAPTGSLLRTARVLAVGLVLWAAPLAALRLVGEPLPVAHEQYLFFSGAALVTFGGAYAVLTYVMQATVHSLGWISSAQAIDGMALAETTPGPLIMVLQFVGFMTGWNHPGPVSPLAAATVGAALTTWATFLPSMLFIFLGAPWVESLRHHRAISRMLAGVTAAVLGVLVHLAVVFGTVVVWPDHGASGVDVAAAALALVAFALLARRKLGVLTVVLLGAAIGLLRSLLVG